MRVVRLRCNSCETSLEGSFQLGQFLKLGPEQMHFVDVFLKCRGKIKDVEEELGISYPTVVARMNDVITAGLRGPPAEEEATEMRSRSWTSSRRDASPPEAAAACASQAPERTEESHTMDNWLVGYHHHRRRRTGALAYRMDRPKPPASTAGAPAGLARPAAGAGRHLPGPRGRRLRWRAPNH
jgi:hypothetical protein